MPTRSAQPGPSSLLCPGQLRCGQIYGSWVILLNTFSILYKLLKVIYDSEEYLLNMNTFTTIGVSQMKEAAWCNRRSTSQWA